MPSHLGLGIDEALRNFNPNQAIPLNDRIPFEPADFYRSFGYLEHPRTREPVKELATYQIRVWKALQTFKRVLAIKSNKIGLSTSQLMADFQLAVLPEDNPLSCRGYDQLMISQTKFHAEEHLRTMRKMLANSRRYSKYLIDRPQDIAEFDVGQISMKKILRDEQTKTAVIYIRNPSNENRPSRIIALGMDNAGAILSWKNVKHIHMSDPTAATGDYSEAVNAAFTRLANTDGSMVIETMPDDGPQGRVYELYRQYKDKEWQPGDFKVYEIVATEAVQAGVISKETLEAEKIRLGVHFGRFYEAKWQAGSGNIFRSQAVDLCTGHYDLAMRNGFKILNVDPAYGASSKFAVLGFEQINGVYYVKLAEQYDRPSVSDMIEMVAKLFNRDEYNILNVDGHYAGEIRDWQNGSGERIGINAVPFNFREKGSTALATAARMVSELKVRIHPTFAELIRQLKTCKYDDHGRLDKSRESNDLVDCFIMGLDAENSMNYDVLPVSRKY